VRERKIKTERDRASERERGGEREREIQRGDGGESGRTSLCVLCMCERKRTRARERGGGRTGQRKGEAVGENERDRGESAYERERGAFTVSDGMREHEMPWRCRPESSHLTCCPSVAPPITAHWYTNNVPTHATSVVCVCAGVRVIELNPEAERQSISLSLEEDTLSFREESPARYRLRDYNVRFMWQSTQYK